MTYNNQVICIFHKKSNMLWCLDGIVSAYILREYFFEKQIKFLAGTYTNDEEILNQIGTGNKIFFLDFTMSAEKTNRLGENNDVTVIDHHKSAFNNLSKVSSDIVQFFDMGKSGARLTWEYFYQDAEVPPLVLYIESGDLYIFGLPNAREVCAGIYDSLTSGLMHQAFGFFDAYIRYTQEELIEKFVPLGLESLRRRQSRVEFYMDSVYDAKIQGHTVKVIEYKETDTDLVSTIGNALYRKYPEIDFAVIVCVKPDICYVNFRSSGFDCEPIAKSFGGGGHHRACGCTVKKLSELFELTSTSKKHTTI